MNLSRIFLATAAIAVGLVPSFADDKKSSAAMKTQAGVITNARLVAVNDKKHLGLVLGGTVGGVAGNFMTAEQRNKALGTIGGVAIGGLIGNAFDNKKKSIQATEYTVKTGKDKYLTVIQEVNQKLHVGQNVFVVTKPDGTAVVESAPKSTSKK